MSGPYRHLARCIPKYEYWLRLNLWSIEWRAGKVRQWLAYPRMVQPARVWEALCRLYGFHSQSLLLRTHSKWRRCNNKGHTRIDKRARWAINTLFQTLSSFHNMYVILSTWGRVLPVRRYKEYDKPSISCVRMSIRVSIWNPVDNHASEMMDAGVTDTS